jgi:methylenetetrahydrofolate reductase (NADPH)
MSADTAAHPAHPGACLGCSLPPIELSIEIFPPRTPEAMGRLWGNLELFAAARPRFISVTCGAGGSGQDGTFPLVLAVRDRFSVPVAAHLTCAAVSREGVEEIARRYWQAGIRRIVALRGDPPRVGDRYQPRPDGYAYASELIAALRRIADFEISAACYPETHPEAPSPEGDIENLRRKVDAGAVRLISQYCFDTERIMRFRDSLATAGIKAELVPGIMPIHSFSQIRRFSQACGASIPPWLDQLFQGVEERSALHAMLATGVVVEQCRRLAAEGLSKLHVYALNRAELPQALLRLLGVAVPVAVAA